MARNASTYTKEQVERYFKRVNLPEKQRVYDVAGLGPDDALDYLARLQRYQLAAVPFENLSLHYSHARTITLHPDELFKKIVMSKSRGGYCMENNAIFGTVLRTLGYTLYSGGARVKEGPAGFVGWSHMINIVTIGERRYMVDVGFGPNCAVSPLSLEDGVVSPNIEPASARLKWKNIEENADPNQRLWVYQHRINDDSEFQDMICFTELEFFSGDYRIMNLYTSTSNQIWFTQEIVCAKMLLDQNGDEIVGTLILQEDLKRREHGKTEHLQTFKNEGERLKALEDYFSIRFDPGEQDAIKGMVSEVKADH